MAVPLCPKCDAVLRGGRECRYCGFRLPEKKQRRPHEGNVLSREQAEEIKEKLGLK